jgi:hypothetical protein
MLKHRVIVINTDEEIDRGFILNDDQLILLDKLTHFCSLTYKIIDDNNFIDLTEEQD